MRDTFIDIQASRPYNGDPPYIFRFDEGQSVGLNYIKKICMVSDSPKAVIQTEKDQTIFRILKMSKDLPNDMETVKMNLKVYADLESLIAADNEWECEGFQYNLAYDITQGDPPGEPTKWVYIYMFYILGRSEDPGEYTGAFWINGSEYRILADFYAENEILKENLKNFESKLPESIQKAIYENDVHEELNDNILINRKNKELLMNYMDIMGNKGSYDSILNSINWFEWGELLRLEEYWKRYLNDNLDYDYFATELNHQLTPEDLHQLANHVKTTFIGIHCALNRLQMVDGKMAYQDSFGRTNIQSMTSWQDMDASHMYAPGDMYRLYVEGDHLMEPAIIAPINSLPGEEWDDLNSSDLNPENIGQGTPAEIGTEEVMTSEQFDQYYPGTMKPGSNTPGNWAEVDNPDGTITWIEVTEGNTGTIPSGAKFWEINFNYVYNEQMPNVLRQFAMWSGQDLSLKMTVLGNFFSSFFMPIHLDLIHSCIEYWAYAYALKLIYTQSSDQKGYIIGPESFDMIWDSDLKIAPHPETRIYKNTLFKNYNTEKVFGFSTDVSDHELPDSGEDIKKYNEDILKYFYAGECCPIRFIGKIYSKTDDPDISIYEQKLIWIRNGGSSEFIKDDIPSYHEYHFFKYLNQDDPDADEYYKINDSNRDLLIEYIQDPTQGIPNDGHTYSKNFGGIISNVSITPDEEYVKDSITQYTHGHFYMEEDGNMSPITDSNKSALEKSRANTYSKMGVFNLDFNIGFKESGKFELRIEFKATNGRVYCKTFHIDISDFMHNKVEVMKLVPAEYTDWASVESPLNLYQYAGLPEKFEDRDVALQSHFFSTEHAGDPSMAGLNHTIIGIVEKDYRFNGDPEFDHDMNKTIWHRESDLDMAEGISGPRSESPFEGVVIKWMRDGESAVWRSDDDPSKWPEEWGEYTEAKSDEYAGVNIPDTYKSGRLNKLVSDLEDVFPDYWWSWDRIQISKRGEINVKAYPFDPYPKGEEKEYPDEYPAQ